MAVLVLGVLMGAGGCGELTTESDAVVPLLGLGAPDVVNDQYFIIMPEDTPDDLLERTKQQTRDVGGDIIYHYEHKPRGFAARILPEGIKVLRRNPNLDYIETDRYLRPNGVQTCAPWGLDRIDQATLEPNGVYTYDKTGLGVDVYVFDTGIDKDHDEFKTAMGTRVVDGKGVAQGLDIGAWNDCHGHGTHIAGIIGGKTFGVAKEASLHSIRVVTACSPACDPDKDSVAVGAAIVDGIAKVIEDRKMKKEKPAVATLAFSVPGNLGTLNGKIKTAVEDENIVFVVSAGNDSDPSCDVSPGQEPTAITVGALGPNDAIAPISNQGGCVDVFAPGVGIPSARLADTSCINEEGVMDGTSQAAAHAAGVAALLIEENPTLKALAIREMLLGNAPKDLIGGLNEGTANKALYSVHKGNATGTPDADTCDDGFGGCDEPPCTQFCAKDGTKCCGGLLGCGGGLLCDDKGGCQGCGTLDALCCAGSQCLPDFACDKNNVCSCGDRLEPCCAGDTPCDTLDLVCDATSTCVDCGGKDELCCTTGCDSTNLECDTTNHCVECGIEGNPCCAGMCNAGNLACNDQQICETCGGTGDLCCDGACNAGNTCNPGTNRCEACGQIGQQCCGGACAAGDCNAANNMCQVCGNVGELCCNGACTTGRCNVATDVCDPCGGAGQVCCPTGPGCAPSLECGGNNICTDICGGFMGTCCPGGQCDNGSAACIGGNCHGFCYVRCRNGVLLHSTTEKATQDECTAWADDACQGYTLSSTKGRVQYNYVYVLESANCGDNGEACCTGAGGSCKAGFTCKLNNPVPPPSNNPALFIVDERESCSP